MWPYDPDEFESLVAPPEGANHDDAWYFPYIEQQLLCVLEEGSPRPIDADQRVTVTEGVTRYSSDKTREGSGP